MIGALVSFAVLSIAPYGLSFRPVVSVDKPVVTLADVADLASIPAKWRDRAGALIVARFDDDQSVMSTTSQQLSDHARVQMPVLGPWLSKGDGQTIRLVRLSPVPGTNGKPSTTAYACVLTTREIRAGAFLTRDAVVKATCSSRPERRLVLFDRAAGALRAAHNLPEGSALPDVSTDVLARLRPGQTLTLSYRVGPVQVERSVTTARPALDSGAVFVRPAGGTVFSAPAAHLEALP